LGSDRISDHCSQYLFLLSVIPWEQYQNRIPYDHRNSYARVIWSGNGISVDSGIELYRDKAVIPFVPEAEGEGK
jgi:hypothetical protein